MQEFKPVLFTGSETPMEKADAIDKFTRQASPIMIMSLRSGAGVDGLQEVCSTAVFGELDWSPGVHEQCEARLNRDGVNRGVNSYYMVSDGGSDPPMVECLGLKTSQVRGLLGEKSTGASPVQADPSRLRKMAESYLQRHSKS